MHHLAVIGTLAVTVGLLMETFGPSFVGASSHRETPLISNDPAADTTDIYVVRIPHEPSP